MKDDISQKNTWKYDVFCFRHVSRGEVQGVRTPSFFQYSLNCAQSLKLLSEFRRSILKRGCH